MLHPFNHQHFDGLAAGHKLKAELVKQGLFQGFNFMGLPISFIQGEINVEVVGKPRLVNNWNGAEITFKGVCQAAKRQVSLLVAPRGPAY